MRLGLRTPSSVVDYRPHDAATSPLSDDRHPSNAQIEAGNYKLGTIRWNGLLIRIENPNGSVRAGVDPRGKVWLSKLRGVHYGYVRDCDGQPVGSAKDGDKPDVFVGPHLDSDRVFVIDQVNADGSYDEAKCVIGARDEDEARALYLAQYSAGWKVGPITSMSVEEFKRWLLSRAVRKPLHAAFFKAGPKDEPRDWRGRWASLDIPDWFREQAPSAIRECQKMRLAKPVRIKPGPLAEIRDIEQLRRQAARVYGTFAKFGDIKSIVRGTEQRGVQKVITRYGERVVFPPSAFGEICAHSADARILMAVPALPKLMRAAFKIYKEPNRFPLTHRNYLQFHTYLVHAKMGTRTLLVKLTTREEKGVQTLMFYDAALEDAKKALRDWPYRVSIPGADHEEPSRKHSIAHILAMVNRLQNERRGTPIAKATAALNRRFDGSRLDDVLRPHGFGKGHAGLTNSQARYLLSFPSLDAIRDRLAEGRRAEQRRGGPPDLSGAGSRKKRRRRQRRIHQVPVLRQHRYRTAAARLRNVQMRRLRAKLPTPKPTSASRKGGRQHQKQRKKLPRYRFTRATTLALA